MDGRAHRPAPFPARAVPGLAAARLASQEKSLQADEQQREDVQAERTTWRAEQPAWPVEELIFLDESGIDTAMTRRYARAQGGRRAIGRAPAGHWRRLTLLGALGREGLVAMMTVPRATDTEVFLAFVEQVLLPALKTRRKPVVILDRLSAHRSPRVLAAFAAAGVEVRFLPPYSPDLNPIEPCWSKIKTALRSAAARTLDALNDTLPAVLNTLTAQEAQGWFRHCGYATA
jgi:transposase